MHLRRQVGGRRDIALQYVRVPVVPYVGFILPEFKVFLVYVMDMKWYPSVSLFCISLMCAENEYFFNALLKITCSCLLPIKKKNGNLLFTEFFKDKP